MFTLSDTDICIIIGTCVSADTCINEEACEANIECLSRLKTELTPKQLEKYNEQIEGSIEIIQKELEAFRTEK